MFRGLSGLKCQGEEGLAPVLCCMAPGHSNRDHSKGPAQASTATSGFITGGPKKVWHMFFQLCPSELSVPGGEEGDWLPSTSPIPLPFADSSASLLLQSDPISSLRYGPEHSSFLD